MEFLSKLKSSLKRGFTVLCATVMVLTSGILTGTELTADAATLHGSTYLNEALNVASGGKYREPLNTWQAFLDAQSKTDYYKGTPYSSWLYAASPKGDLWQRNEGYGNKIGTSGGTNCTGFVWHIISNGLAKGSGQSIAVTGTWVPNAKGFNSKGFSRSCWSGGRWYDFITKYNVHYYEFGTKSEMLSSGVLQKGDIIWCVNASQGSGLAGLSNPDSYHHIGIYMGDGKSDSWWQSGPVNGDGNSIGEINSINQIYGKAKKNTYVVVPWAESYAAPTFDPTFIRVQKQDTETGTAAAQGGASLAGAEFTFKYYTGTSATGTPEKTWVLKTNEKGFASLSNAYLVSGSPYKASNGSYYLPLGTVTIQETKAPTGYKLNNQITTLYIEDHDKSGKATVRVDGSKSYLQEYTVKTDEDIIRGDLWLQKQNGETGKEFANIPFLLENTDTGEQHLLMTDKNGQIDTEVSRTRANILDAHIANLEWNGSAWSVNDETLIKMLSSTSSSPAGVWFGKGNSNETDGALPYGNYRLTELRCRNNDGLHLIQRTFQITASKTKVNLQTLIDTSAVGTICGKKVNADGDGLSGAVIGLFTKDTTEFTVENTYTGMTAISGKDGSFEFPNVPKGSYIVHEIAAPDGYLISDKSYPVTVNVNKDGEKVQLNEDIINTAVTVDFTKVDSNGNPLKGATLQIIGPDGNLESWISDGTVHTVIGKLAVGEQYVYNEFLVPDGYVKADPIRFTIQADGSITDLDGNPLEKLELVNIATKVEISKFDENENLLTGAKMQVLDAEKNILDEWITDGTIHVITGKLAVGKTYTLHEVSAPDGYYTEEDMTFTVDSDGTASVGMVDTATWAGIRKVSETGGNIAGAVMQIIDEDGTIIDEWTTTAEQPLHTLEAKLNPGATYILHEVSAPEGYFPSEDIPFQVSEKGELDKRITMIDVKQGNLLVGKISDIQQQSDSGEIIWLPGAVMQLLDKDGKVLDEWTTDDKQHTIAPILTPGASYTLHEVSAPDGYCVAADIPFTLDEKGQFVKCDSYESGGQWIRMTDLATKIEIQKTDENNKPLSGAALQILDKDENVVDSWISGETAHEIIGVLTAGEVYTLHEVSAPNGYVVASDVEFTVNTDGSINVVSMYDDTTKVSITKQDITTGAALAGATLQIIGKDGNVVEEWVSGTEAHMIEAVLTAGETYTLRETAAPNGYVIAEDISFTVNPDGTVTSVVMKDDVTKVSVSKYDITGETELTGASMEVRDAQNNVVDAWISDGTAHQINGVLIAGAEYTLHEVSAPNGYVVANDVTFTVNSDGSVTPVAMYDYPTVVHITKKDITTGEELPGAYLELYDKDHNLIDAWVSTEEAHIIEAVLIAGEKYTLIETSAPDGYVISEQVEFTVNLDNTITHVEMLDKTTKVQISKKSITGDEELPGASMQLLDKNGNIVDEWISGTEPHFIEGVLIAGETYTLHEESAPNGYVIASDVEFTVSETGEVDYVEMIDDTTKVEVSKTDITGEKNISGATLQIIDKDGNVIHEWISGEDVNYLEAELTAGETYTLHEESAPNGFVLSEDVEFTVNPDGTVTKVQMEDDTTKVSITKYDLTTGEELPGATLQIIDKDGNVIEEWVSSTEAHLITGILTAGETYTLREITAPNGWTVAEDVTFTVNADGSITHVEMYDKPVSASIRKVDVSGKDIAGAVMQILDKNGNVVEEWTTDGTAHVLTAKLTVGETYTLHEKSAPAGYELAKDQTFTVPDNGEITVIMTDEKTPTTPPIATPTTPTPTSTASPPKTGDAAPVMAIGTGLLASFIIMLLTRKKKRKGKAA